MVTIVMMMMVNLDHDNTILHLSQTWSPRTWQWLAIPFAKEGKGRLPSRSEAFDEIILIFDQMIIRLFCFLIKWSSGKTQQVQPSTLPIPLGGKRLVPGEMMGRWSWWDLDDDPVYCYLHAVCPVNICAEESQHSDTFFSPPINTCDDIRRRVNPFLNIKKNPCLKFFFRWVCWRESDV